MDIKEALSWSGKYNLHSHTQYCDGHAPMEELAAAACAEGMTLWGITPHSPLCIDSPCNMRFEEVDEYLDGVARLRNQYAEKMLILPGMEIDYLSPDFGPHLDYFQKLPLEVKIGSVHFVPDRHGVAHDCDGSAERFQKFLHEFYHDDLRYVVEKYFEQVLNMQERGGFDILGHFDKIAGNASSVDAEIENQSWYESLIDDVISHAKSSDVIVEINTKALATRGRFYPHNRWWQKLKQSNVAIAVNSDAHEPTLVNAGRPEALSIWASEPNDPCFYKHKTKSPSSATNGFQTQN